MLQNFFNELSFLDAAKDGNFFLCHSKTKHRECFNQTVPVFSRGDHQRVGVGFTFCNLQNLIDIQLPMMLNPHKDSKSRNFSDFKKEISLLLSGGITHAQIAKIFGVSRSAVTHFLNNT